MRDTTEGKREYKSYVDNGETVAEMNVDGMPWYSQSRANIEDEEHRELSKQGVRAFTLGTMSAALLVSVVFAVAFLGLILLLIS